MDSITTEKYNKYCQAVSRKGIYIKKVPQEYLNKDIILLAVENNGLVLNYIPDKYKDIEDVVLTAINQNLYAIEFASIEQKKNRNIIIRVIEKMNNSKILMYIDPSFHNDKELMLLAIKNDSKNNVLAYVSDNLKDDFDIVFAAVKKNGHALREASDNLKNNKTIGLEAIKNAPNSIQYLSSELKNDDEIIQTLITHNDRNLCTELAHASARIRKKSFDIVLNAVKKNWNNYKYVLTPLKYDKRIVLAAIDKSLYTIKQLPEQVRRNTEIVDYIVQKLKDPKNKNYIDDVYTHLKINEISNIERIINLLKQDHNIFKFLSEELQNNSDLILEALKYNINIYKVIPTNLLTNKNFIINCYESMTTCNTTLLKFLDKMLDELYKQINDPVPFYLYHKKLTQENYKIIVKSIEFLNEIDKINKGIYNLSFIKNNSEIIYLLNENIISFLIENKEYEIIYKNEKLSNISKDKYNIIIMSNSDINPDNEYNSEQLEILHNSIQKDLSRYKVFFI